MNATDITDPGSSPDGGQQPPPRRLPELRLPVVGEIPPRALAIGAGVIVGWLALDNLLPRGLPLGMLLFGAVFGSLNALVAIGLVLVYRANRILNFAQAELGSVAAVLAIELRLQLHWNFFIAAMAGLMTAAAMGALIDIVVIRRFRRAPRLIAAVATLGIAQLLFGVSFLIPVLWQGASQSTSRFEVPFSQTFQIFPVTFTANHVLAMVIVPFVLVGITHFLTRTDYGVAIRAVPENGERASLVGVPVNRLSTIVWVLAATLSALAIIVRTPILGFTVFGSVSGAGSSLLLRTLAAAVIGRMESLPVTALAAIGLGMFGEAVSWQWSNSTYVDATMVAVILVAMLVQRGRFSRATETGISTWSSFREVRPVPAMMRRLPEVRMAFAAGTALLATAAMAFPLFARNSHQQLMALIFVYAILAVSLVVLTGWGGQMSLGQFALAGFGGATTSLLIGRHGWDFFAALAAGTLVGAAVAVVIGLPALRITGPFLAVTTLGIAVSAFSYFLVGRYFPWFIEATIERPVLWRRVRLDTDFRFYYVCLVGLLLSMLAVKNLRRSRFGRALIATRDNELAAQASGIHTAQVKLTAFAVAGGLAGFAGGLYTVHQYGLNTDSFAPNVSLSLFTMVVIGGLGSPPGAILGAFYVRGAEYFLPGYWAQIASGIAILLLLMFLPGGLGQVMYSVRDRLLRMVALRRRLVVPSLLADVKTAGTDTAAVHSVLTAAMTGINADGAVSTGSGNGRVQPPPPITAEPVNLPTARTSREDHLRAARERSSLLVVRGLDAAYDGVQVLFGVDFDVEEGEIVALLGSNGAGKTTLAKAISGLVERTGGVIMFDGHDITDADVDEAVRIGIVQTPGGRGIFPGLSVADNMRVAGWMTRADPGRRSAAVEEVLGYFPILRDRWETAAGSLSGGEQQMLSLAIAFVASPRLLIIDELSLGLAPTVVDTLLGIVKQIHDQGTTVVLIEQSVSTSLKLADRCVFMEKGEVQFSGLTAELLDRPDVLRSVYLEGAAVAVSGDRAVSTRSPAKARTDAAALRAGPVVLETIELTKNFGGVQAVNAASIQLHKNEILGLIGPNGAGKTTIFDLISGFVPASAGRVRVLGADVTEWPPHKRALRGLGRSFQDSRLWGSLTVAEALATALDRHVRHEAVLPSMLYVRDIEESERAVKVRADELIEMLGLEAFRDKFVSELSTGSKRIVEIAAGVALRPAVLLLDEPSSGIAQRETEALGPFLRSVREYLGCSLLVIEHDMQLVTRLADRMVALDQGAVIAEGSPSDIVRHPQVVESYLGSIAEQIQEGTPGAQHRRRRRRPTPTR